MKTINQNTISMSVAAVMGGSVVLSLATGLPLPFAVLGIVAAVTATFGVAVMVGALLNPMRGPLSIARSAGRFSIAAPNRPITRPARVAA